MAHKRAKMTLAAVSAVFLMAMFVTAVLSAQQANNAKPAEPKYTEIKYSADASSYKWEGEDKILVLTGSVKFTQGDTIILADKVEYHESTRTANITGNLKIYDDRNTITGETGIANFKEKKCSVTGNVKVVSKPKPKTEPGKTVIKDEVTITCAKIDYLYKEKKAFVPSPVTIVQKTRTITADSATYIGKDEIVHLVGNVKGQDDKEKHSFSAPKVTISLRDSDQWVEAEKATGTFYIKDDDGEKPATEEKAAEKPAEEKQN